MSINKKTGNWIYSDYSGIKKIDHVDKSLQLNIHQEIDIQVFHFLSVIKMNSTYLEIANRPYEFFGLLLTVILPYVIAFNVILPLMFISEIISIYLNTGEVSYIGIFISLFVFIGFYLLFYKVAYPEIKDKEFDVFYYHPIRLNRKNKKIYVFKKDGEIKIFNWNELFFYIAPVDKLHGRKEYELRAALVNENDDIEFSFSLNGPTTSRSDFSAICSYWEFLRQYMQDGPKKFYINKDMLDQYEQHHLNYCNDIDGKLESYETTKRRVIDNYKFSLSEMISVGPIFYPWIWVRRYLIKHKAKIPLWPEEVEQECQIEEHDPYIVDASINQYFEIKTFPAHMRVKKKYLRN